MEKRSDQDILILLGKDPQAGMEALIGQYTGLLWSVAAKYLSEPEDVRECVDDTFVSFYMEKEQYQAEKGSLALYLAAIARNKAISCYRRQRKLQPLPDDLTAEPQEQEDPMETTELRMDLETLLENLKPEDADILRMKYYKGMSFREIADSLGLPYETVKKRHTRSLRKMKKLWLITLILILLALLAACAHSLLRYFGIISGLGMSLDENLPVYRLAEEVSAEGPLGFYRLEDLYCLNGYWTAKLSLTFPDRETMDFYLLDETYEEDRDPGNWTVQPVPKGKLKSTEFLTPMLLCSKDGTIRLQITSQFDMDYDLEHLTTYFSMESSSEEVQESVRVLQESDAEWDAEWNVEWMGALFPIHMVHLQPAQGQEFPYDTSKKADILANPRLEDGELIVEVYPFGRGDDEVSLGLVKDQYMQGQTEDITAFSPEGQTLTGMLTYLSDSAHYGEWNFGPAEPGSYSLHIPYLYMIHTLKEPFTLPFDLETGEWGEASCQLPGFSISITDISPVDPLTLSGDQNLQGLFGPKLEDKLQKFASEYDSWRISVELQSETEDVRLLESYFYFECPLAETSSLEDPSAGIPYAETSSAGASSSETSSAGTSSAGASSAEVSSAEASSSETSSAGASSAGASSSEVSSAGASAEPGDLQEYPLYLAEPYDLSKLENGDYLLSIHKKGEFDLSKCRLRLHEELSYQWMHSFDLTLEVTTTPPDRPKTCFLQQKNARYISYEIDI